MLVLATLLFIVLSPGLILTLPPFPMTFGGLVMSSTTNHLAIFVHGALYFAVLKMIATNTWNFGWLENIESEITGSKDLTF